MANKKNRAALEADKILAGQKEKAFHQLYTSWGKELPPVPKAEYPRPQMVRKNRRMEILNGLWQYAITFGDSEGADPFMEGDIIVPFSPETEASGVGHTLTPEEVLHYRRTFLLREDDPALTGEEGILLHFGAVDQECLVYVNGNLLGQHIGGYLAFSFDITRHLHSGENEIRLLVRDMTEEKPYPRGKQKYRNQGPLSSIFYPCQSGIWKTVWMEWVPQKYVKALRVEADYDMAEVRVAVEYGQIETSATAVDESESVPEDEDRRDLSEDTSSEDDDAMPFPVMGGRGGDVVLEWGDFFEALVYQPECIQDPETYGTMAGEIAAEGKAEEFAGMTDSLLHIPMKDFKAWDPDTPWIYPMKIRFHEDEVDTYFAMRCFSVEKDSEGISRICLNHRKVFLNGLLDQGYWPESLMTAPGDQALIYDIQQMKSLGYNTLRKHVKVEEDRFYYHCDRLGMMVIQDMPNGGGNYNMYFQAYLPTIAGKLARGISDQNAKLFRREDQEGKEEFLVELEEMIRQLGSHPCIAVWVPFNEGWGQFDASAISLKVKEWDPTRLVNEACGWFDQKGGDFYSIHNYYHKLKVKPQGDRVVALTEYGGFAYPIPGHMSDENNFGYRHYNNEVELTANYEKVWREEILPAIRRGLCCSIYTQVSDICEEQNGLMTWDREILKVIPERFRAIHKNIIDK